MFLFTIELFEPDVDDGENDQIENEMNKKKSASFDGHRRWHSCQSMKMNERDFPMIGIDCRRRRRQHLTMRIVDLKSCVRI